MTLKKLLKRVDDDTLICLIGFTFGGWVGKRTGILEKSNERPITLKYQIEKIYTTIENDPAYGETPYLNVLLSSPKHKYGNRTVKG